MPIDPSIALGVRPIEQPNMLAQMGQMMALRQAQQGYESENALKDFYAQGGDLSKPEDQRKLMSTVGAKGADLIAKQFALQKTKEEVKKLGYDNVESEFKQSRGLLSSIDPSSPNAGAQLIAWHEANHKSPIMGSILAASGIDAASSRASIEAAIKKGPAGITEAIRRFSMGQADYQKELMQTERTQISAAAPLGQLTLAQDKDKREQDQLNAVLGIVSPERTSSATATPINMGGAGTTQMPPASGTQMPPAGAAPVTPPAGAGAITQPNVLATQVAPQTTSVPVPTTVNNLGKGSQKEQLVDQISQLANLPTIVGARALENKVKEYNVLYPTEKIEQDRQGNLITIVNGVSKPVLDVKGLPVQGKPLPETGFERTVGTKTGEDIVAFVKRVEAAPKNIAKIDEALGILKSGGAVTGFGAENRLNLQRAMSLFGDDVKSGKRVVDTQILDALLGSDVFPSLQSLGLGSKNIDTPAEREYLRQVITGTIQLDNDALIRLTQIRRNVETNAIKEYNQKLESGKFDKYSKAADQKLEKIEVPNPIIRKGTHKNGRPVIEYADGTVEYGN
jgi:hypothetical protein